MPLQQVEVVPPQARLPLPQMEMLPLQVKVLLPQMKVEEPLPLLQM